MEQFLSATRFIDSGAALVVQFAHDITADEGNDVDRVKSLFRAVRDEITYDPYVNFADPLNYRASGVLLARRGFCVGKAALLAACARAVGIPARVGFADVRNHLTSPRLYQTIKSDVFIWHSYAEIYVLGQWLKATPAFDATLCERLNLAPLDFDGRSNALFHAFDRAGRRHMEYLKERGTFTDVPFEVMVADFVAAYPSLMSGSGITGDFQAEAVAGSN